MNWQQITQSKAYKLCMPETREQLLAELKSFGAQSFATMGIVLIGILSETKPLASASSRHEGVIFSALIYFTALAIVTFFIYSMSITVRTIPILLGETLMVIISLILILNLHTGAIDVNRRLDAIMWIVNGVCGYALIALIGTFLAPKPVRDTAQSGGGA